MYKFLPISNRKEKQSFHHHQVKKTIFEKFPGKNYITYPLDTAFSSILHMIYIYIYIYMLSTYIYMYMYILGYRLHLIRDS